MLVVPRKPLELTENQLWFAERQSTGFLVSLWLDAATAEKLSLPSGESADSLHITLAYCGDTSEMTELAKARIIVAIEDAVRYQDKLEGRISGYGRFAATDSSDGQDVFYATPDIPRLVELRQSLVNRLWDLGVQVNTNHGFSPHITLAYLDSDANNPVDAVPDLELKFNGVTIVDGLRRIDLPFWTPDPSVSMYSDQEELPLDAPLGSKPVRPLYFGSFDKEWIPFLPTPGNYFREGDGELNLTSETYDQMLKNFDAYVFKQDLPIRATHTPQDGGAVGWIKPGGMRLAEDGSLEVKPEWNELGKGLVEDDRFKYVSAEFCKVWTNPVTQEKIPNVAVGLALVTRPHFKTDVLNPLSASEALAFAESSEFQGEKVSGVTDGGEVEVSIKYDESGNAGEGTQMADGTVVTPPVVPVVPATSEAPTVPTVPAVTEPPALTSVVLSDLTQVVITAEQRKTERQMFADLSTRVELAERRATTAEAEVKRLESERRKEKFTAEVIGRSAENGQPWFGNPQENVSHLVSLAESYGDDSAEVRWAVTQKRNEAAAIVSTKLFDPISLGATEERTSVIAQVTRLAEQYRLADKDLTMEQAVSKAYAENPDLYVKSLK